MCQFSSNLESEVVYMVGIKYVNLVQIGLVFIEIQGNEGIDNGNLVIPVNHTLACSTTFLAAHTQPLP